MPSSYRFVIADDHPLFRGALREALFGIGGGSEILEAGDFDSVRALMTENEEIDLVLLDLAMPGTRGLSGFIALRGIHSTTPIAVISAYDDGETIRRALDLGASGFIPKSAGMDEIRQAVRLMLDGEIYVPEGIEFGVESDHEISDLVQRIQTLTPQQARVLAMLAEGLLNKQIAYELNVSEATIKAHVSAILQKLGVDSRTQAVIRLSRISGDKLLVAR